MGSRSTRITECYLSIIDNCWGRHCKYLKLALAKEPGNRPYKIIDWSPGQNNLNLVLGKKTVVVRVACAVVMT